MTRQAKTRPGHDKTRTRQGRHTDKTGYDKKDNVEVAGENM